jgi:SAM-dependent methyltransferase
MPETVLPADPSGVATLAVMSAAPRYNAWMYEVIAPFLGRRILEVGSGIGNLSAHLLAGRPDRLVLTDTDAWYRQRVAERFADRPEVRVDSLTLPDSGAAPRFEADQVDTVVALNVVEHIEDDVGALATIREILTEGRDGGKAGGQAGRAVVLVPALQAIYGEMDRELRHYRRYSRASLEAAFQAAGLRVETMFWFNRAGVLGWWFNGRVRRVRQISLEQIRRFDSMVPLLRWERWLPVPFGQSLIAVGTPR